MDHNLPVELPLIAGMAKDRARRHRRGGDHAATDRRSRRDLTAWAVLANVAGMAVFLMGVGHVLTTTGDHPVAFDRVTWAALLLSGVIGRGVSLVFQAESAIALGGSSARERSSRRVIVAEVAVSQLPLAVRDAGLGLLALLGILDAPRVLSLSVNLFDPFLLLACYSFARRIGAERDRWDGRIRGLLVGYIGYAVVIKLLSAVMVAFVQAGSGA